MLIAILHWIWPPDRCHNCQSIYSVSITDETDGTRSNVGRIQRTVDGRFVLSESPTIIEDDEIERRQSTGSQYSSSDDGGFLARRSTNGRASWRRPLVASPSQLSLQSDTSRRSLLQSLGGLLRVGARYQNIYRNIPVEQSRPLNQNLHINTISGSVAGPVTPLLYTPSRVSRIFSSSPASTTGITSPWVTNQFSDLSTVYPSSAERSFPTPSSGNLCRYRYSQELPALRTIQEETRRMNQGFVPLHVPSPSLRGYYYSQTPYHSYRPRTRWFPRHSRIARSNSELLSPLHLNLSMRGVEASPESRSSSSGFGSKNTSNQQQGSHSGSTSEWRLLPPYRPPPPPPSTSYHHYHPYYYYNNNYHLQRPPTPPYTMNHWLDMISRLNAATENVNLHKAVDVGSVDGHYEFDPSTPTPSASTPTGGPRDDLNLNFDHTGSFHGTSGASSSAAAAAASGAIGTIGSSNLMSTGIGLRKQRASRYDNIEARVQAMKEEFYAYRKRQAMKRAGVELESAC